MPKAPKIPWAIRLEIKKLKAQDRRATSQRRANLKRDYGITLEQYVALWLEQGGLCALCRQPEVGTYRGVVRMLSVDHDHETGQIRGLLCGSCNVALGWLEIKGLKWHKRAKKYLE
jgi:Recombination endonuclease VII